MPPRSPFLRPDSPWRLVVLALIAFALVVAPVPVLRYSAERLMQAERAVAHARQVKATVNELMYRLRELETAALLHYSGVDSPVIRQRIDVAAVAVPRIVDSLAALTRDNAAQQVRVGGIKSMLEQRVDAARALGRIPSGTRDLRAVQELAQRNQIRERVQDVVAAEESLLRARTAYAGTLRRQIDVLTWGSMIGQLLLLAAMAFIWMRQARGRMRAEHVTAQASERAMSVLQTVREPIVLLDADQRVVLHNAAFSELYGVAYGDAHGQVLRDVGGGAWSDPVMLQRLHDVVVRNRELWDHEQPQRTADGVDRTMLVNARLMPLPNTEDKVALVTVSDVTVQKATEAQMRELNRQLEGKVGQVSEINRELEAFSYSVSHDLRAPLRHVAGFADKLRRHLGESADEKSVHYLEVIGSSARRMSTLIDDLLVYSRLGRGAMRLQAVDMQSLVAETRSILDSNLASDEPDRRVEWSIAPLPIIVADENMMRQVWLNLLGNAVKYSNRATPAKIEVLHRRDGDNAHHFEVRDNGAGFDMQYATKLFGVFQRMHKASDYPGTGIGLASVRRVLQRHGGRIWAESTVDAGSTFHFVLPASLDATPSTTGPSP